jgi:hypothetical protein
MKLPLKRVIIPGVLASLLVGSIAFVSLAQAGAQVVPRQQMSEEAFKNVTVLKGIPVDEFMGTMGLFSAALGVCCAECHVGAGSTTPQWDADVPKKQVARRMVQMVNTINRTNFGGAKVVTCWTCHRGSSAPSATPPMDMVYGEAVIYPDDVLPPTSGDNLPTVDQVFDKYIQALGGTQRLAALTSWVAKGTSTSYGEIDAYPAEMYAQTPNKSAMIIHQADGDMTRTYDGRTGWIMLPLNAVDEYPLNASMLEGAKLDAQLAFPMGIRPSLTNWHTSFPVTVNGRTMNVVQGNGASGLVATLFFDAQTGLLTRMIRYANSAVGRVPTQIDFSDYRPVAGVMMPFKWNYSWISGREDYTLAEIQPNVAIDAAKFAKPVQRAR